jgi:general secretion pathway protein D
LTPCVADKEKRQIIVFMNSLIYKKIRGLRIFLLALPLLWAGNLSAQDVPANHFRPEFREIEISDFLKTMSQITKKNILIDDSVRGKITIVSQHSIPVSRAFEFMKQVLEIRGFAVIEEPNLIKVVLQEKAADSIGPTPEEPEKMESGIITKVLRLPANANILELQNLVKQLTGKGTTIAAYRPTNSLIITGYSVNVVKAVRIIRELIPESADKIDTTSANENVHIYQVKNMPAESLANVLVRLDNPAQPGADKTAVPGQPQMPRPGEKIQAVAHKESNSIIVTATQEEWEEIKQIIEELDQIRKQILLEVLIAEISSNDLNDFGIDWRYLGNSGAHTQFNSGLAAEGNMIDATGRLSENNTLSGFSLGFIDKGGDLLGIFNANVQNRNFNVLSAPQILTLDNQEAEIKVGQDVPVRTQERTSGGGASEATVNSFEYRPSGIQLKFTPHVSADENISLELFTEVTTIEGGLSAATNPTFNKRNVKTSITVVDRQTIVIGGLVSNEKLQAVKKIPILGDIPILGHLFRRTTITDKKTNLMVFLTPHLLNDRREADRITGFKRNRQIQDGRDRKNEVKLWPEQRIEGGIDDDYKKIEDDIPPELD